MKVFGNRAKFHETYSMDFVKMKECERDDFFDFVYLDGNHSEVMVAQELRAFWPKVKKGGLLCGHDFEDRLIPGVYNCGVETAVRKWLVENPSLELWVSNRTGLGGCDSWWVRKPL
jgi:hypothetical protein